MLKMNCLMLVLAASFVPTLSFAVDVQTSELKSADELMLQLEQESELGEESLVRPPHRRYHPRPRPYPPRRVVVSSQCFASDRYGRMFSAVHRYAHHAQHLAVRRCERATGMHCHSEGCRSVRHGHRRGN